ncbi:adenosylcobinamide-phosphate synthase CbiB [Sphingomonas sp. LaA6.9]|uniref:adenosylcobinamide-phosphate synthase CbiB n=1 Tax=Sphingomonas sp. LaA6.9 TaxID=2919914 RepID=UPI001F500FF1|nr:adenosylcobinamide-phosphate synthase CbiB [Sphingomonas sp. LaA6.9]MCJ8159664.1 adenosylcobinamide-phosphate synthase CbiB [Sphingomonas sp. LaA6.9]
MVEPTALAALAIESATGYPDALYRRVGHPVGLFARVILAFEQRWNRPDRAERQRRGLGILAMAILVAGTFGAALALEQALWAWLAQWGWAGVAIAAVPGLAQQSLHQHVAAVAQALAGGNLAEAREKVAMIVGRDTAALDAPGIARAGIESLAESFCDGVVAPAFWLMLLGLPGLYAYKAINTADSLIGHREERWRAYGWAAARLDDAANWIPARLSGVLVCLAGRGGWRTMRRDARRHASPNAGWPEAAMAGALDLRLGGPVSYDGVPHDKPWLGDGRADAGATDMTCALSVYRHACALLWAIAGVYAWAL